MILASAAISQSSLRNGAAKIVARSADARLVFIGRSPENLFDYLSSVFEGTEHEARIGLLNISNRYQDIDEIRKASPAAFRALQKHFEELAIAPAHIISSDRPGRCVLRSRGGRRNLRQYLSILTSLDPARTARSTGPFAQARFHRNYLGGRKRARIPGGGNRTLSGFARIRTAGADQKCLSAGAALGLLGQSTDESGAYESSWKLGPGIDLASAA